MERSLRVLIVHSEETVTNQLAEAFRGYGHTVVRAGTETDGRRQLRKGCFDLALIRLSLPDGDGLKIVAEANGKGVMAIVVADSVSVDAARSAIRRGAYDYLLEPVQLEQIPVLLERAMERKRVIEERETVLKKLMESERLALIGTIATGMAHELKNPLATIEASIFNLREILRQPSPEVETCLQAAEAEIETSTKIIHDLLGFATNRRFSSKKNAVPLKPILTEILARRTRERMAQSINVTVDVGGDTYILGDEGQIRELFHNIILNAFQSMPSGGVLRIRSRQAPQGAVRIEVSDTGQGILPEHMERIMEPFFTTKTAGLGMGLYICSEIVKAHNGKIEVTSGAGEGTTFTISLPEAVTAVNEGRIYAPESRAGASTDG